jgi:hypothetical protein
MEEKHNVIFKPRDITDLKKVLFTIMKETKDDLVGKNIHDKNIYVLSKAKEIYISNMSTTSNKHKPNIRSLEREKDIYGNRDVSINEMIPQRDPYMRKSTNTLDKFLDEREDFNKRELPDISKLGKQITEKAENTEDFLQKLKYLENERNIIDTKFKKEYSQGEMRQAIEKEFRDNHVFEEQDPKNIYSIGMNNDNVFKDINKELEDDEVFTTRQDLLIPLHKSSGLISQMSNQTNRYGNQGVQGTPGTISIQKYISINSIDREWTQNIRRYNYSVTFNGDDVTGNYKNIRSIEVGKVIIPEEISENINILNAPNKTQFNYEFSFSYPYLILRIDEFNDVYDGTNDNVRKSFCKLVYHKSYKAPNGRGYVILKPLQNEKKYFYPSPLSTLSRMSISLLKPNGYLLNDSTDSYKIFKVDYDRFNPHYYHIVTDVFFDKNEFYVGDVVLIKGFSIESETYPVNAVTLNEYINRPEGHEVLQIGSTNDNGFWRSFYIKAIGTFDRINGKFDADANVVSALNEYNDTINYNTFTGSNGSILNTSLQNTIGMSVDVLMNDVSHIETMLV